MLRIIAFIIVVGFFAWQVPKWFKTPEPTGQMVTASGGLSRAEVSYYRQIFDYTMDNVKPDQNYAWKSYSASGNITVAASFISKSGATCRKFKENFNIQGRIYNNDGVGCKRNGADGWCKLRNDNAMTCAMEADWVGIPGLPIIPDFNVDMPTGTLNTGGIGSVNTNVNTNVDMHINEKKAGSSYADTVTGTAGSIAGPATGRGLNLFNDLFR